MESLVQQQQGLIKQLHERQEELRKRFEEKGYVVAGYGGDTYYAFIGAGRGFNGAALAPMSRRPQIFDTVEAAEKEAYNGTYRNGRNDVIQLKVVEAATYFRRIYDEFEKNIAKFKEEFEKL